MMRRSLRLWVVAALSMTLLALAWPTAAGAAPKPLKGGTVSVAHTFDPTVGYDPINSSGATTAGGDNQVSVAIFDHLMFEDYSTGKVVMQMAKSLTSNDGTVWTLTLKSGIKFSDGTALDATAVKFNWERIADPANRSTQAAPAQTIASMEVVDPLTLKITLKTPNGQFPRVVAKNIPWIGSPTAIRADAVAFRTKPIGAGPFLMQEWVRGSQTSLVRNPTYWQKGKPYLDRVVIKYITDPQQRLNSFAGGESQVARTQSAVSMYSQAKSAGYRTIQHSAGGGYFVAFNMAKPPFNDKLAREAMTYALDRVKFNDTVNLGAAPAPTTLFLPSSPFYDKSLKLPQFDPTKAQAALDAYAQKNGKPLEFTYTVSTNFQQGGTFFISQLAQFKNLKVTLEVLAPAEAFVRLNARTFEMSNYVVSMFDPEPDLSTILPTGATRNFSNYTNPEMDAALLAGKATQDIGERRKAYATVQRLIIQDLPLAFFQNQNSYSIVSKDLVAKQFHVDGEFLWDRVYLKKVKK